MAAEHETPAAMLGTVGDGVRARRPPDGMVARFERSHWGGDDRGWAEVRPADFVILEGVTSSRAAFRPFLTYSVWIETPSELRLHRGLERDGDEARGQWERWMAEEERYAATERPDENADLVVRGDRDLWT